MTLDHFVMVSRRTDDEHLKCLARWLRVINGDAPSDRHYLRTGLQVEPCRVQNKYQSRSVGDYEGKTKEKNRLLARR
jgi:hypothetical protein